jgi:hypothetical protein
MKWVFVPSQQSLKADVTWTEGFIYCKADCRTVFEGVHHVRLNRCHSQLQRLPPPPQQVTHRHTGLWQWQNRLQLNLLRAAVEFSNAHDVTAHPSQADAVELVCATQV